ncbi:MAG TPA: AraC family transcriptional regulator [Clostridiales bacterium]|nr:AraC family transcriptional regulator [Clostridiales bacterium]
MEKNNKKHSKILKRFLFSYSVIIVLPLLVGLISYKESATIISNDTKNTHLSMLRQSMEIMDRITGETDRIACQMAVNPQVIKFCYAYDFNDKSIYYNMWETLSYIKPYSAYENAGSEYNIYFNKSDMVFNQNGALTFDEYYKHFGYQNIDIDEFRQRFLNIFNKGTFISSETVKSTEITTTSKKISNYNVITYFKTMPLMNTGILNAVLFVRIKEDSILKFLRGLDVSDDGCVYILDENSEIITGIPAGLGKSVPYNIDFIGSEGFVEKNINGKTMYIVYTVSSYNGWKYVSAVPAHIVMAKVNSIRNLILGITVVSLIIGIILLILLAYANSKPIIELKKTLLDFFNSEDDNKKDEFDFLKSSISDLIHQSSAMKSDIQKQRSTLQKSVIERLLLGRNIPSSILDWASQAGVELGAQAYTCVLIGLKNVQIENDQLQEFNIGQIIHNQTGQKGYLIDINPNTLCLLLCLNTNEEQKCKQHTERVISWISNQIQENLNIIPTFTIGSIYYDLSDIYHAYNEAKQALDFMPIREPNTILWYSSLEMDAKSSYYYPIEVEQRLIHLVKYGYKDDLSNLLSTILEKNLENPALLHKSQMLLRHEINGTIYKLNIGNPEDVVAELDNCESLNDVFKCMQTVLNNMCDDVNEQKNNRNIKLVDEIIAYMESNFSDSGLCLSQVATEFNLSEGYISQLFKEHTGEYFAAYLENIRLEHACQLLERSSYTINEVALRSGYNSPQSFRRAFKRVNGFNPSDYKV